MNFYEFVVLNNFEFSKIYKLETQNFKILPNSKLSAIFSNSLKFKGVSILKIV